MPGAGSQTIASCIQKRSRICEVLISKDFSISESTINERRNYEWRLKVLLSNVRNVTNVTNVKCDKCDKCDKCGNVEMWKCEN